MGILPLFAFAGVLWSVRKRLWSQAFVPLAFFSAYFCLLALDDLQTLGYARQNLHILPVTIALALPVLVSLTKSKRILTLGLLAAAIVTNVFLYPFDLKTGIPKPYWGCHNVRWFETHFPIKETVDWLLANKKGRPTIAYMHDYGHAGLMWALERAGMKDVQQVTLDELCPAMAQLGAIKPEDTQRFWMYLYFNVFAKEEEGLAAALYVARRQNTELVIYLCVSGTQPPSLPEERMADYKLAALFKTPFRAIAIFELPEAVLQRTRPPLDPSIPSPRE
jgi:hypothetical protein